VFITLRLSGDIMADTGASNLTSLDLFAGCGGLTRGLEWAGFNCIAFNEINKDAANSFAINFPEAIRLDGDIRDAVSKEVIEKVILPKTKEDGIDLVCGGPPCQGFSGIGHRRSFSVEKEDIPTNHLFQEMIRVINKIQPNVFLFENVQGLLSSKWTNKGVKGEIFRDVWKAFSSIKGYVAQPTLIHAYGFGVPQNRPRVMIMGIKKEIVNRLNLIPSEFDSTVVSDKFQSQLRNNGGFFPKWSNNAVPSVFDAISDLEYSDWKEEEIYHRLPPNSQYQKMMRSKLGRVFKNQKLTDHIVSNHSEKVKNRFQYMIDNEISNIRDLPEDMRTKKFSQKLLPKDWGGKNPTITCCSNSDDYIHYSMPRALSVREWARLQTFPDHHLFSGSRTTGGVRRAGNPDLGIWDREVPKYTQIGNAVPPLLGKAIGIRIKEILSQT
jgi:DNA (cytosine-5)-methyltransferase 1